MIQPHEGNYRIAQQGIRAIRHVLDQVLAAPTVPAPSSDGVSTQDLGGEEIDFAGMGLLDNIDIDDRAPFLDWLDGTADGREPWLAWMNFS